MEYCLFQKNINFKLFISKNNISEIVNFFNKTENVIIKVKQDFSKEVMA